jgi:anti-sigma regulatory factor (Ser/Thr protein kinase)
MPKVIALPALLSMVPATRVAVRNLLRSCPRVDDAESITSEMVTNAIRHSTSRSHTFGLSLDVRPNWLRIEVTDSGPEPLPSPDPTTSASPPPPSPSTPPPPPALAPPTLPPPPDEDDDEDEDLDADYSRGLTIIRKLSDRWGHDRYPDHSVWWAELVWTDPSDADG